MVQPVRRRAREAAARRKACAARTFGCSAPARECLLIPFPSLSPSLCHFAHPLPSHTHSQFRELRADALCVSQLPNFPHPPVGYVAGGYDEEDIISNPSMENMRARYVEVEARPMMASSGTCFFRATFVVRGYMLASCFRGGGKQELDGTNGSWMAHPDEIRVRVGSWLGGGGDT